MKIHINLNHGKLMLMIMLASLAMPVGAQFSTDADLVPSSSQEKARSRALEEENRQLKAQLKNSHQEKTRKVKMVRIQPPEVKAPLSTFQDCPDCPEMVVIPAGNFDMGSPDSDEGPVHHVIIKKAFALGKTEITRGQFAAFVSATNYDAGNKCWTIEESKVEERSNRNWHNPGFLQDDNHPVACINWNDAKAYTKWLSEKTGKVYQLPGEAQWKYACRAGGKHKYCGSDNIDAVAWYNKNSDAKTHPVGGKLANGYGLYDMSGNVWEWVEDGYHDSYQGAPTDGSVWEGKDTVRVLRGGSWGNLPENLRAASRDRAGAAYRGLNIGFRLARMLP
jgi:formylglycine-generating enzyme required for sulfatase activity